MKKVPVPVRSALKRAAIAVDRGVGPAARRLGVDTKGWYEYAYWRSRALEEGTLGNTRYERMFTDGVALDRSFYAGKRILDVGCGPRGSLEWAHDADFCVGLDPLVERYRKLGIDRHAMRYVGSPAERMPFPDGIFDVVSSFNALDHVDDPEVALAEMVRVLAPGGMLILVVDIHPFPTVAEPHVLPWTIGTELGASGLQVVYERHLEKEFGRDYLAEQRPFDHEDATERYGVLVLRAVASPADG